MKTRNRRGVQVIALATLLTCSFGSPLAAQEDAWTIGPRSLPPSGGVSEVFREYLAKQPTPDVEAAKGDVFKTAEEWEAWIRPRDEATAAAARKLARALSVTVKHDTIAGVNVYHVTPAKTDAEHKNHLFVHVHGGAYVVNGGEAGTVEAVLAASYLKIPVLSIDYRMPPSHPAPAAMKDVIAVWRKLSEDRSATTMAMGGTSAGAGLTMSSVQRMLELGLEPPQALFLGTPGADVTKTGDSRYINEGIDPGLVAWDGVPHEALKLYAGDYDHKHPYVSPIYGKFEGFPPSYLISGTRDLMLSDTVRTHRELRRAGVEADLHVYEGQAHAEYLAVMDAPESAEHFAELNRFLLKHLSKPLPSESSLPADAKDIDIPKSTRY
jgi:monoterpene epsilon-lactone hydrolase